MACALPKMASWRLRLVGGVLRQHGGAVVAVVGWVGGEAVDDGAEGRRGRGQPRVARDLPN
eukprot:6636282-Prymnesium_polylepis.1